MRVLAIESSGRTGSIALLDASGATAQLLVEHQTVAEQRTAQSLVPAMKSTLAHAAWRPADVELVCVTTGPGSFTGLRIGVVAAKTFAYAVGAKLVGVHTLSAIAAAVEQPLVRLWTVLDAQRQEFFVASFDGRRSIADQATPATEILNLPQLLQRLQPGDAIAGPPLAKLAAQLPAEVAALAEPYWQPQAAAVGALGIELFQAGAQVNPIDLVPRYFRKSAAEEKAERGQVEKLARSERPTADDRQ